LFGFKKTFFNGSERWLCLFLSVKELRRSCALGCVLRSHCVYAQAAQCIQSSRKHGQSLRWGATQRNNKKCKKTEARPTVYDDHMAAHDTGICAASSQLLCSFLSFKVTSGAIEKHFFSSIIPGSTTDDSTENGLKMV